MRLAEVFSREPNPIRVAHSPGNSNGRTRQRLYPAPPGSFSSDLLDRALAPVSADLTSDLAHGDLVPALFLCSRSNGRKSLLFRSDRPQEISNAHDHYLRFAPPVHHKPRVLHARATHNLTELRPGGQCGNDFRYRGSRHFDHELINWFTSF